MIKLAENQPKSLFTESEIASFPKYTRRDLKQLVEGDGDSGVFFENGVRQTPFPTLEPTPPSTPKP